MTLLNLKSVADRLFLSIGLGMVSATAIALQMLPEVNVGRTTAILTIGLYLTIMSSIAIAKEKP